MSVTRKQIIAQLADRNCSGHQLSECRIEQTKLDVSYKCWLTRSDVVAMEIVKTLVNTCWRGGTADAEDSKSFVERRGGSNPLASTNIQSEV